MRPTDFALERFFARWEFKAELLLCASDVEGWAMRDLLTLADEGDRRRWDELSLGYTESPGDPALRTAISELYEHVSPDEVLVVSGAEDRARSSAMRPTTSAWVSARRTCPTRSIAWSGTRPGR
jgi:hypothetical protein